MYERVSAQDLAVADLEDDSENAETMYAGYAMASAEFGPLTALGGLRVEHTVTETDRFQLRTEEGEAFDSDENLVRQTFVNAYTSFFPSVHLTLDATEALQLRASVSEGNPSLAPFKAMNFDLAAEYYRRAGSRRSAASTSGSTTPSTHSRVRNGPYRISSGRAAPSSASRGRSCATRTYRSVKKSVKINSAQIVHGPPLSRERLRILLHGSVGTVTGLEIAYQQPFTFLPAPLNAFGLNANTTITTSDVDVPQYEDDPTRPDYSFFPGRGGRGLRDFE